eukprot:9979222-Alexandrium_andersonii.AAC.1
MSASLVGSEMCIRDRDLGGGPKPAGRSRRSAPTNRPRQAGWNRRQTPVSYTHLTLPTICSV